LNITPEELKDRMDRFKERIKGYGVKLTHQRLEIYREIAKSVNHPDAASIFRGVRKRVPTISLDTVYRTLWMLFDMGIITTLGLDQKKTRFDANMKTHHHFVCLRCGKTLDFYSKEFDRLKVPDGARTIGNVQSTQVVVKGSCVQCLEKI
jgi:Fur family peroxide stress response transcriptional regulator